MLCDVADVCWRPRATLLAMITMRKSTHGFPFLSYMGMVLRLGPFEVPELRYENLFVCSSAFPACSFQQSIPHLILSMSILVNTLPTMDSRVMPRQFLHS